MLSSSNPALLALFLASGTLAFQTIPHAHSRVRVTQHSHSHRQPLRPTSHLHEILDPEFVAGSALWTTNFYYGFDWLLAPLGTGLDSDFNPATRTATLLGRLLRGDSIGEASKPDERLDFEMGTRMGSGANADYVVDIPEDGDWLDDRSAGLRSSAPLPIQLSVLLFYSLVGVAMQSITGSLLTGAVLCIPALVYEIGRPSLPTREEAVMDAQLDLAVKEFVKERVLLYGQDEMPNVASPVRRDEATNERELVAAFRGEMPEELSSISDFQIEIRMRSYGSGRSNSGFIKGVRLLKREKNL